MSKKVIYKEKLRNFKGTGVIKNLDGTLKEISLGVVTTGKRMTETGMKEVFKERVNLQDGEKLIAIEVDRLEDRIIIYSMPVEDFKRNAEIGEQYK